MKQIQIENGVIRYYGNRVGRVTEGCAVVDPMFQNEALESFLRKQRNIQKIQWQDGIYDRLANSQQDMESAKGLKDVRIWQLRGDVDVHMKFLALFQMEQQYGSPKPDFYIKVYEGASDTNDLEELYDKFRYHPPSVIQVMGYPLVMCWNSMMKQGVPFFMWIVMTLRELILQSRNWRRNSYTPCSFSMQFCLSA